MHVASTIIMEGPPPITTSSATTSLRAFTWSPASGRSCGSFRSVRAGPVWVDDPHLNLDYHIRQTALPPPGSEEQLRNLAARIFSQQLDRSKPLWEMWLAEGLEGDRFAIITKSHHCPGRRRLRGGHNHTSSSTPPASRRLRPRRDRNGCPAPSRAARSCSPTPCSSGRPARPRSLAEPGPRSGARVRSPPRCSAAPAPPARCSAPGSPPRPPPSTSTSGLTGASASFGPTSTSSSGSRTSTAARSTTSSFRPSPGRWAAICGPGGTTPASSR